MRELSSYAPWELNYYYSWGMLPPDMYEEPKQIVIHEYNYKFIKSCQWPLIQ